ncbi:hypothetical protein B0H67DRAFT_646109 [Lasiosphaeris hirsuta]|uniref:Uncharacterized protein n=1 Tax=Lasiosphaeris hirsuta TaxID=260670 RepID=A0AA40A7I4_9PEZI|nr:hypothetical protein B0H67DRAFT_646109 [Lasiosphaeris hirsuta]
MAALIPDKLKSDLTVLLQDSARCSFRPVTHKLCQSILARHKTLVDTYGNQAVIAAVFTRREASLYCYLTIHTKQSHYGADLAYGQTGCDVNRLCNLRKHVRIACCNFGVFPDVLYNAFPCTDSDFLAALEFISKTGITLEEAEGRVHEAAQTRLLRLSNTDGEPVGAKITAADAELVKSQLELLPKRQSFGEALDKKFKSSISGPPPQLEQSDCGLKRQRTIEDKGGDGEAEDGDIGSIKLQKRTELSEQHNEMLQQPVAVPIDTSLDLGGETGTSDVAAQDNKGIEDSVVGAEREMGVEVTFGAKIKDSNSTDNQAINQGLANHSAVPHVAGQNSNTEDMDVSGSAEDMPSRLDEIAARCSSAPGDSMNVQEDNNGGDDSTNSPALATFQHELEDLDPGPELSNPILSHVLGITEKDRISCLMRLKERAMLTTTDLDIIFTLLTKYYQRALYIKPEARSPADKGSIGEMASYRITVASQSGQTTIICPMCEENSSWYLCLIEAVECGITPRLTIIDFRGEAVRHETAGRQCASRLGLGDPEAFNVNFLDVPILSTNSDCGVFCVVYALFFVFGDARDGGIARLPMTTSADIWRFALYLCLYESPSGTYGQKMSGRLAAIKTFIALPEPSFGMPDCTQTEAEISEKHIEGWESKCSPALTEGSEVRNAAIVDVFKRMEDHIWRRSESVWEKVVEEERNLDSAKQQPQMYECILAKYWMVEKIPGMQDFRKRMIEPASEQLALNKTQHVRLIAIYGQINYVTLSLAGLEDTVSSYVHGQVLGL